MVAMAVHLPLDILLLKCVALIVGVLPFRERDRKLGKPLFINEQYNRDNGQALFLYLDQQFIQFALCEKKFPVTLGIMVVISSLEIFRYVHVSHKQFSPGKGTVRIHDRSLAVTDGFDLGPRQLNTGCNLLEQEVLMMSLFILYDNAVISHLHLSISGCKSKNFFRASDLILP